MTTKILNIPIVILSSLSIVGCDLLGIPVDEFGEYITEVVDSDIIQNENPFSNGMQDNSKVEHQIFTWDSRSTLASYAHGIPINPFTQENQVDVIAIRRSIYFNDHPVWGIRGSTVTSVRYKFNLGQKTFSANDNQAFINTIVDATFSDAQSWRKVESSLGYSHSTIKHVCETYNPCPVVKSYELELSNGRTFVVTKDFVNNKVSFTLLDEDLDIIDSDGEPSLYQLFYEHGQSSNLDLSSSINYFEIEHAADLALSLLKNKAMTSVKIRTEFSKFFNYFQFSHSEPYVENMNFLEAVNFLPEASANSSRSHLRNSLVNHVNQQAENGNITVFGERKLPIGEHECVSNFEPNGDNRDACLSAYEMIFFFENGEQVKISMSYWGNKPSETITFENVDPRINQTYR